MNILLVWVHAIELVIGHCKWNQSHNTNHTSNTKYSNRKNSLCPIISEKIMPKGENGENNIPKFQDAENEITENKNAESGCPRITI